MRSAIVIASMLVASAAAQAFAQNADNDVGPPPGKCEPWFVFAALLANAL
jgi:hypothetical protein